MPVFSLFKYLFVFSVVSGDVQPAETVASRVSKIAEKYSNWALGQFPQPVTIQPPVLNSYKVTQVQSPPRFYNPAPVKQFFHPIRVHSQPIYHHPKQKTLDLSHHATTPSPTYSTAYKLSPLLNSTVTPYYYQQVPAPMRISELLPENRQLFHSPLKTPKEIVSVNPNFPRLVETEIPMPPQRPLFSGNASSLPNHMSESFGASILSQLFPPIQPEPFVALPTTPPPILNTPLFPSQELIRELPKSEVMQIASKKNKFGMPRFNMLPTRGFYQPAMCLQGWCGDECCDSRRQMSPVPTTIQAIAMPGSPTPPHPLVLVVHPSPAPQRQCSPACQPLCSEQCISRLQYLNEAQLFNTIHEPACRPDCMPSCHVDCLIIPPQQVRCNNFHCQCLAGYVQCAAFTCCMRYPNMAARMRSNVLAKSSEETSETEEENDNQFNRMYTPIKGKKEKKRRNDIQVVTLAPSLTPRYWTKQRLESSTKSTSTAAPCTTTTTTTSTTTTAPPITTTTTAPPTTTTTPPTTTTTTTTTTTPAPSTTTTSEPITSTMSPTIQATTSNIIEVVKITPIYPDMIKDRKVPMIPAYGLWALPPSGSLHGSQVPSRNSVGDIRGRHVIRSENFLDVLSELAQVKLKEDITNDFSQAADIIEFMTDRIRKL